MALGNLKTLGSKMTSTVGAKSQPDTGGGPAPPKSDTDKLWDEQMANLAKYKAGLRKQTETAQAGVGAVDEAQSAGMQAIRNRSGQALAQEMNRGGGGSTAALRQSALSRGAAEGAALSDFAKQRQQAAQLAAQAETEEASKLQQLTQQEKDRGTAVQDALAKAKEILEGKSSVFSTEADKDAAAAEIQVMIDNESDPKVKAELQKFKDRIHTYDTDSFDTEDVTEFFDDVF